MLSPKWLVASKYRKNGGEPESRGENKSKWSLCLFHFLNISTPNLYLRLLWQTQIHSSSESHWEIQFRVGFRLGLGFGLGLCIELGRVNAKRIGILISEVVLMSSCVSFQRWFSFQKWLLLVLRSKDQQRKTDRTRQDKTAQDRGLTDIRGKANS